MRLIALLSCVLLMSACSYFDEGEAIQVEKGPMPHKIDLMANGDMKFDRNSADTILDGGSVEVYGDDHNGGTPSRYYSNDPSVEVFPLDDDMRGLTAPRNMSYDGAALAPVQVMPAQGAASSGSIVYFEHGSAALDDGDRSIIEAIGTAAGNSLISVEGHASQEANITDPVGRKITNLKMSMNRALSVARRLIHVGVPAENIRTVAWGETRPVAASGGLSEEEAARRVEILAQ